MNKRLPAIAAVILLPTLALFAAPPTDPMLRFETGMHVAMVNRIGVDSAAQYVLTCSDDKTAKLWDIQGNLLTTYRVPVDVGGEGKVYACALSPDASTVFLGGWTGYNWDGQNCIYVMDRRSGEMLRRLKNLPHVVLEIRVSPDGRYLAAGLNGDGIRVWDTRTWAEVGRDSYSDACYGLSFSQHGGSTFLGTSSYEGFLRLYDVGPKGVRLLSKATVKAGTKLNHVSFTPAGDRVAVGISETAAAEIYTIRDGYLSFLADVDSSGISGGNFSSVCFSADGRYLYAGGRGPTFRRWSNAGTGPKEDLKAGNTDTILDLMALADGRMIFAAADPIWGIVGPDGAPVLTRKGEVADFMTSGLRVSDDGMKIAFRPWGENTSTTFDVTTATLTPNATVSDLTAASKDGLAVADYNDNYTPTLDGKALVLERYERSRCVSVLPDHSGLVLGSDWNVRLFDASGQQKWKTGAPATVWGVDVAPNGRTVVAEFSDGTLRWYRISDGKEIAAFFPHTDHKRWVLATASGYYDCSPGGEDLMGWIVNRGADATPDFYPASRFRSTYYRPDIVRLTISLADEQLAIAKANEGRATPQNNSVVTLLPAVVKITSPDQGAKVSSNVVTIHYKVDVPSGDTLSGVRALVDGRPPEGSRGLTVVSAATGSGSDSTIDVPIPSRDCTVSLIAETARTTSEAATVRLVWGGNAPSDQFIIKPKLYVLAIGVSAYEKTDYRLKYAAKDATDFAAAFSGQKGVLYRDVVTKVLTDSDASRDDIMDGLDWIQKETTSKDVAAVFLSGHGVNDQNGVYYYLPVNADIDKLKRTCVPFSDIKNTVQGIAGKVLFFVDTCHSGNVMGSGRRGTGPDMTAIVNELSSAENGAVVFSSSTGSQYSLEDPSWGNGAFTKALVEGLAGKADYTGGGKITVNMLDLYISERVKQLTGGQQTPTTMKPPSVPDFPVAVK